MASPNRRRRNRLARRRTKLQQQATAFNKRIGWSTQIVHPAYVPGDLRDVTPDVRIVPCDTCGSEGRLYERMTVYERDAPPHDDNVDVGPCSWCEGTGGEIIEVQPIEMEDLP